MQRETTKKETISLEDFSTSISLEPLQMDKIYQLISPEFPGMDRRTINNALLECCAIIPPPRPREFFIDCLRRKLQSKNI